MEMHKNGECGGMMGRVLSTNKLINEENDNE